MTNLAWLQRDPGALGCLEVYIEPHAGGHGITGIHVVYDGVSFGYVMSSDQGNRHASASPRLFLEERLRVYLNEAEIIAVYRLAATLFESWTDELTVQPFGGR